MAQTKKAHTGGMGLFIIMAVVYVGLLLLFAWQTWEFVDWLFPNDQILMKILTVLCFDIMALLWACLDLFYKFAVKGARTLVRWAWAISFILSLLASIFYLVINSMFRFHLEVNQTQVDVGYGVVIFAVTLQVLFVTFWIYIEWNARHPHQDEYEHEATTPQKTTVVALGQTAQLPEKTVTLTQAQLDELIAKAKQDPTTAPLDQADQSSGK